MGREKDDCPGEGWCWGAISGSKTLPEGENREGVEGARMLVVRYESVLRKMMGVAFCGSGLSAAQWINRLPVLQLTDPSAWLEYTSSVLEAVAIYQPTTNNN